MRYDESSPRVHVPVVRGQNDSSHTAASSLGPASVPSGLFGLERQRGAAGSSHEAERTVPPLVRDKSEGLRLGDRARVAGSGGGAQRFDLDDLDEPVLVAVDKPQAAASGVEQQPAQVTTVTALDVDVMADQ